MFIFDFNQREVQVKSYDKGLPGAPPATEQDFPIVGIGASRGGLNAFKKFLKVLPEKSGMAFVIVQHLDPGSESILPELLSKVTNLPVNVIENDIHLAPDNIYVIPPNKTLTTFDGVLKITPRENLGTNALIDVFFTSLAEVHQMLAVGIVLTGTGTDGTLGLRAVKKFGGITFAQDVGSAFAEGMPGSAADANVVDFILPVEEIPFKLIEVFEQQHHRILEFSGIKEQEVSDKILLLLNQHFNIEFTHYKQKTIQRRIARRISLTNEKNIEDYYKLVLKDKNELDALYKDLLIPVTFFFRDQATFDVLKNELLPLIFGQKESGKTIRIWSAGCSTGQEAYSLAMLIYEYQQTVSSDRQVQIFATDVSQSAIISARKAVYTVDEIAMLSEHRRKNYFIRKSDDHYQLIRSLREMCVFAEHNFIKGPPFSNIDLLSCRNVLIYMEPYLQKKALTAFHYALNSNGFLLQGKSETTAHAPDFFSAYNNTEKIYKPNALEKNILDFGLDRKMNKHEKQKLIKPLNPNSDFRRIAETMLLKDFTPANVIINDKMEIVYIHGDVSPFLEPSQGRPTFNLLKMAREGLAFELRSTFYKVKNAKVAVKKEDIPIMIKGKMFHSTLEIVPIENCIEPYFLIVFKQTDLPKELNDAGSEDTRVNNEYLSRIAYLEKELSQLREDMRSVTEDQEIVSEELQSANEEMLSSNEELQSLNEELESSKEELINSNEELRLLIDELQQKNKQIEAINKYTDTIMSTIRKPMIVFDCDFKIKTINQAFYDQFDINNDIAGHGFFEVRKGFFDIPKLRVAFEKFCRHRSGELETIEVELNTRENKNVIFQLNATKFISPSAENLILLSFIDITQQKINEKRIKDFSDELASKVAKSYHSINLKDTQLEQYAHTTNHEFQEPLRKLITFSKYISKLHSDGSPEKVLEYVGKIENAAYRMSVLINDMQNYASVKHHSKLFQKTDLNHIVKDIISDFELLIEEKKAKVVLLNRLPEIIAIPFQMNQLFYDLLSNALKFVRSGVEPLVTISSSKLSKTALKKFPNLDSKVTYYQINIEDNGIGFNQKYAMQIFTMFQRLIPASEYPETGIGLALCKKIVDDYHGHIYAEGIENTKAVFHVIIPEIQP